MIRTRLHRKRMHQRTKAAFFYIALLVISTLSSLGIDKLSYDLNDQCRFLPFGRNLCDMRSVSISPQAFNHTDSADTVRDFVKKVTPVLQSVATERGLQILFNGTEAGFAWVDPGLDLTDDVIKKLDAAGKTAAAPATPKP